MTPYRSIWCYCEHGKRNSRVCRECWDKALIQASRFSVGPLTQDSTLHMPLIDSLLKTLSPRHTKDLPIVGKK